MNGTVLREGDGAAVTGQEGLQFVAQNGTEVLVFDLT
jgi:hypothetical protein